MDSPNGAKMREALLISRRKRRNFTWEFKAEAVRLTRVGDRTIAQVAVDLDLTETALRDWVKHANADEGKSTSERLTAPSRLWDLLPDRELERVAIEARR